MLNTRQKTVEQPHIWIAEQKISIIQSERIQERIKIVIHYDEVGLILEVLW